MMKPADAERISGYKVGGISPFGQKRKVPTVIEAGGEIRAATANAFLQVQKGTITNAGTLSAAGEALQTGDIVSRLVLGVLVGPQIGADHDAPRALVQPLGEGVEPGVVEPHPVDDGPVLAEAEQARLGIAGLGPGRDRAAFDEAEAEARQAAQGLAVLVQTRRQTDRIGQVQPRQLCSQDRVVRRRRRQRGQRQPLDR